MAAEPPITVDALSKKMDDRKGVWWAVQSSKVAAKHTTPHDQMANSAAEAWVKNPNPQTAAAAADAAKKANLHGPGAWAAQAAAWSAKPPAAGAAAPGAPGPPAASGAPRAGAGAVPASVPASLVPHAVAGSVKLAAALHSGAKLPELPKAPAAPSPAAPKAPAAPGLKIPGLKMPSVPTAPKVPSAPKEPAIPKAPALKVPTAPKNPVNAAEEAQLNKIHSPFIKLGMEIHAGKKPW